MSGRTVTWYRPDGNVCQKNDMTSRLTDRLIEDRSTFGEPVNREERK